MKTIARINNRPVHFNNLFESILGNGNYFENEFSNYFPPVNISETTNAYSVELQVPGYKKEDFKLEVKEKTLEVSATITSENSETQDNYTRKEFSSKSFKRSFNLPETADKQKIEAKYENGILNISIAKKEIEKQDSSIEIKVG